MTRRSVVVVVALAAAMVGFPVVFVSAAHHWLETWERCGVFGDTFGPVHAMFSGCALAVLIVTLVLQQRELSAQRTELARAAGTQEQALRAFSAQVDVAKQNAALHALATMVTTADRLYERLLSRYDESRQRDERDGRGEPSEATIEAKSHMDDALKNKNAFIQQLYKDMQAVGVERYASPPVGT